MVAAGGVLTQPGMNCRNMLAHVALQVVSPRFTAMPRTEKDTMPVAGSTPALYDASQDVPLKSTSVTLAPTNVSLYVYTRPWDV